MLDRARRTGARAWQFRVAPGGLAVGTAIRQAAPKFRLDPDHLVVVVVRHVLEHCLGAGRETGAPNRTGDAMGRVDADVILAGTVLVAIVGNHDRFLTKG